MKVLNQFWEWLSGKKSVFFGILMAFLLVQPVEVFLGEYYEFVTICVQILFGVGVAHKVKKSRDTGNPPPEKPRPPKPTKP